MLNFIRSIFKTPSVSTVLVAYQKTLTDLRAVSDYHVNKQLAIETKQDKLLAEVEELQVKADLSFAEAALAHDTVVKFNKFLNS